MYASSGNGVDTDVVSTAKGSTSDGNGVATTSTYDLVGNVTGTTSPLGLTTTAAFDLRDHVLTRTSPDGVIVADVYDGYGFISSSVQNQNGSGTTGTNNITTAYAYDAYGNQAQTDADTGSGNLDARTTATYDFVGNAVVSTTYPASAGGGTARTTVSHFAGYHVPSHTPLGPYDGQYLTQSKASGQQLPVAPSGSPAPACPDGSGYCNSVATLDMNGQTTSSTNADGKLTATYNDLAGRTVATVADLTGSGVYNSTYPDQNLTSITQYGINAKPVTTYDTLANGSIPGNSTVNTYDALGRVVTVTQYDNTSPTPVALNKARTIYTGAGRVDRTSLPADPSASDTSLTWTKNVYDSAGNQIRTLQHYDASGNAGTAIDTFEQPVLAGAWLSSTSYLVTSGATLALANGLAGSVSPATGRGDLAITTSSGSANTGAAWDLSGPTFRAGHTYRVSADILAPSGTTLAAYFGVDASGGNYVQDSGDPALTGTGAWQTMSFTWTPTSSVSSNVHFAIRKGTSGSVTVELDNVRIYDTADPSINVPTQTVYDAAGQPIESIAPPSNLQTKDPTVTATAYDPNGRTVATVVNSILNYSHTISAESALTNYWPLGEVAGSSLSDIKGSTALTTSGGVALGQAGAVDEPRTSATFDGSAGQASSSASVSTSGYSIEAWVRADSPGETNRGLAGKWDATNGGALLELDGSGYYTLAHSATSANFLHSSVAPRLGQWDYVVATWDGSTERLYVNNSLVASQAMSSSPGTSSASFVIGRSGSGTSFGGGLDEVALYNAALSATAIGTHYAAARPSASAVRLTSTTRYDALGRMVDTWTDAGTRTHYVLDRLGDVTDATQNYVDGTPSGLTNPDDVHSTYGYDVVGEMTSYCPADIVYANGCGTASNIWQWTYDPMGRKASQTPPTNSGTGTTAMDATTWSYNVDGTLASVSSCPTSACSSVDRHTDYAYDAVQRQTSSTVYAGSGTGSPKVKNATMYRGDGLPVELDEYLNGSGTATDTIAETYTAAKQVDQVKRGSTVLTDYNYNADGTLSSRVDGDAGAIGTTTFSQYDWAHRVTQVTLPSAWTSSHLSYAYNPDGTLATTTEPNGEVITLGYDNARRAASETMSSGSSLGRTFDRVGNVTSDTRSFSGVTGDPGANTNTYTFDALGRLTGESGLATSGATKTYTYDLDSNRTQLVAGSVTFTYGYDQTDQLVYDIKTGGTTQYFSYDQYGNMTGDAESAVNVTTLAYDLADRLTSETPAGGSATTFTYDAAGRVWTRAVPGAGTDTYSYVGTSQSADRIGNSGGTVTDSILDATGSRLGTKVGSTVGWFLTDLLGNIVGAEAGSSTTITDAIRYDGYGQTLATYPSGGSAVSRNWKFQDRLDVSSQSLNPLYEAGARLYSPGIGAFTSSDSVLGNPQNPITLNRYLYAGANAVTNVDPSGNNYYDAGCDCVRASPISPDKTTVATAPTTSGGGSTTRTATSSTGSCFDRGCEGSPAPSSNPPSIPTVTKPASSARLGQPIETAGLCFGGSAGAVLYATATACFVKDAAGNQAMLITYGGGNVIGLSTSGFGSAFLSNGTIAQVGGHFTEYGASAGEGLSLGLNVAQSDSGAIYAGGPQAGLSAKLPIPGELHRGETSTIVLENNPIVEAVFAEEFTAANLLADAIFAAEGGARL